MPDATAPWRIVEFDPAGQVFAKAKAAFPSDLAENEVVVRVPLDPSVKLAVSDAWRIQALVSAGGRDYKAESKMSVVGTEHPGETVIDGDKTLIVDGKSFFPLVLYHIRPEFYKDAAAMGFNGVQTFQWFSRQCESFKAAQELGLKVFFENNDPATVMLSCRTNWTSAARLVGFVRTGGWIEREYHFVLERKVEGNVQLVKIALSASSVAGAARNLAAELPGWDFASTRRAAEDAWEKTLTRVPFPVDNPDADRTMFYTSVYRLCLQPNLISDVGEKPFYSTFSLWDTFRAAHSLYRTFFPERARAFVVSLLEQGRRTGYLPMWPIWGKEANWMIGTLSVPVIVDAYLAGMKGIDWEAAYAQIRDTLTNRHGRTKVDWEMLDRYG